MKKYSIILKENSHTENAVDPFLDEITTGDLQDITKIIGRLRSLKKQELEERMAKAVAKEDYEFAKICKDELLRREETGKQA